MCERNMTASQENDVLRGGFLCMGWGGVGSDGDLDAALDVQCVSIG